ncbi:TPA: dimethylmenaquinone methyltransferase [Burkholderia aenigmatica]|uniref:RraA family protein n=1 Tax=Burkholderia sp. AU45251 TaxID=3059204 RepID=UPI00264CE9FF|nr:dimethylmenaquinone methyltransferase [Burkholderia sp. AU45251]HDR9482488.1 dimethylmenaquinone methyltransferase [Burkholderia aenigmatica]MDN7514872.1 dimethylmenaquinone methyltransferase [Burkholderia sp. AU45251]HDR9514794.1 dimethylmenaquinone methyltransferase [Burkholderia aenigmatica]HDR9590859.1 dimethylmenaquinone methyltransferase [Burkholderia aenigmatica]HDR9602801.1 dimethylmenaquinone methyltransferase [Burkholderia aenigmatica]
MTTVPSYDALLLAQACKLGTSTLYEASGLATSSVDPAIRTLWPGASIAGPAYPLECSPGDNLSIHIAMEQVPRGSVLVVSTGGFVSGYWGEVLTVAAEAAGIVGLVIDGGVRDIAALTARRFPVFTRGICMRGTIKASAPSVGQPISFAGTPVATCDLVVADDDGVLVIPAARVGETLAQGQARADKEAKMMEALREGRSTLELMGLTRWRAAQ